MISKSLKKAQKLELHAPLVDLLMTSLDRLKNHEGPPEEILQALDKAQEIVDGKGRD